MKIQDAMLIKITCTKCGVDYDPSPLPRLVLIADIKQLAGACLIGAALLLSVFALVNAGRNDGAVIALLIIWICVGGPAVYLLHQSKRERTPLCQSCGGRDFIPSDSPRARAITKG